MKESARQLEVIELVILGLSNQEIAERLDITEKTVKFHMTNIMAMHGVKSRAKLSAKLVAERVTLVEYREFQNALKG